MAPETEQSQLESAEPPAAENVEAVYCTQCGAPMGADDRHCGGCGWDSLHPEQAAPTRARDSGPASRFNRLTALLLCLFLGPFGVHRFYVGKIGTGLIWLVTLSFLGLGSVYDLVMISTGEFTDADGRRLTRWQ
jgi:hypothetical protein